VFTGLPWSFKAPLPRDKSNFALRSIAVKAPLKAERVKGVRFAVGAKPFNEVWSR